MKTNSTKNFSRRRVLQFRCGRAFGEDNPQAKLTWAMVTMIRRAAADGWTATRLAALLGVPRRTVSDVINWVTWTREP